MSLPVSLRGLMAERPVLGTFLKIPRFEIVEVLALSGFDFVVCDFEHSQMSVGDACDVVRAGLARGLSVLVRVPALDRGDINRLLEAGAAGIQLVRGSGSAAGGVCGEAREDGPELGLVVGQGPVQQGPPVQAQGDGMVVGLADIEPDEYRRQACGHPQCALPSRSRQQWPDKAITLGIHVTKVPWNFGSCLYQRSATARTGPGDNTPRIMDDWGQNVMPEPDRPTPSSSRIREPRER